MYVLPTVFNVCSYTTLAKKVVKFPCVEQLERVLFLQNVFLFSSPILTFRRNTLEDKKLSYR